ncbi:MAG: hypothetical protein ACK5OB_17475 [Pirellula sp.]
MQKLDPSSQQPRAMFWLASALLSFWGLYMAWVCYQILTAA